MTNKTETVGKLCGEALLRVDEAILNHRRGVADDLSVPLLGQIRAEIVKMREALSCAQFRPAYGRFVVEWPDEHGLVRLLSDLEYQYTRLR